MKKYYFIFLLVVLISSAKVYGASCCGGASAMPSLITGDDQYQIATSISQSQISDDVSNTNRWKKRNDGNESQNITLSGASLLTDRWQIGVNLPLARRSASNDTATGIGDVSASISFESMPEWDYSLWKPKAFSFLQITAPTGNSIYDSLEANALDSRGRGFWSISLGTIFLKSIYDFDASFTIEAHRAFSRSMQEPEGITKIQPGFGTNASIAMGWNFRAYRLGLSIQQLYEQAIKTSGVNTSDGSFQRVTTASAIASYAWSEVWSSNLSYSDQSIFGSPHNTSLSNSVAIHLQRRWPR